MIYLKLGLASMHCQYGADIKVQRISYVEEMRCGLLHVVSTMQHLRQSLLTRSPACRANKNKVAAGSQGFQVGTDLAFWPAIDVVLVLEGGARQC